jgi:hypothetical protein
MTKKQKRKKSSKTEIYVCDWTQTLEASFMPPDKRMKE